MKEPLKYGFLLSSLFKATNSWVFYTVSIIYYSRLVSINQIDKAIKKIFGYSRIVEIRKKNDSYLRIVAISYCFFSIIRE